MARVRYVPTSEIDPKHKDLLGRPIHLGQALVNSSEGYWNHHLLGAWIRAESTLDPRLRELLILQVGFTAKSAYEFSHHIRLSQDAGVTPEDIRAVIGFNGGESHGLAPVEQALLRAAAQLTRDADISDQIWAELAEHFDDTELVEIVLIVGYYNHVLRILRALRIDNEPEYEKYLAEYGIVPGQDGW
jgi:alkylhydroperoxidase family enzyme